MAVANDPYIGAWKIVEVISLCGSGCQTSLEGTEMKLDEAGDVTWILPEGGDPDCPMYRCEVYDLVSDHSYSNDRRSLMLAAVDGHAIVFKVDHPTPQDLMVLTCEDWCILQCQRVACREPPPDHHYSLSALLEAQVATDVTLTAADGTRMAVHGLVLRQLAPSIDWSSNPLRHLPGPHMRAIVHYLYTESLPAGLSLKVAREVKQHIEPLKDLEPLARLCHRFITNVTLREDLRILVRDMHTCCRTISDALQTACRDHQQGAESVFVSPSKMAALLWLCLRQLALGVTRLTLAFDLYGRHEASLDSEERREVIRYAQSRLPVFVSQLQRILVAARTLTGSANQVQRAELASRAVSEIDWLSTTLSSILEECKLFLEGAIDAMSLADGVVKRDGSLDYVLNNRTLLCVHTLLERLTRANSYILQKREYLQTVGDPASHRIVGRNTERLLEELPALIGRLEDITELVDQQINQREFKFYFIATASRVHHIMELLRQHGDVLRPLLDHLQTLVGGPDLTQVLARLGLVETPEAPPTADGSVNEDEGEESTVADEGLDEETIGLSLTSAVTRPPLSRDSELARRCHHLYKSGQDADLKFTVRGDPGSLLGGVHGGAISDRHETVLVAHAPVVAARSTWLRRALTSGMRESIDKQILICDAPPAIFASLLEFLYCGHVTPENWPPEQLMELMVLADRYELDELKHSCEALLESHIDEDSVFCLLSIAEQYNARKLKSSALEFVATNPEVVQAELFLELNPALQAEVEETAVWAPPRPRLEECTGNRRRVSDLAESPVDSTEELAGLTRGIHLRQTSRSSSSSQEEPVPPSSNSGRLEGCLQRLRSIVGDDASRADLIRVVLAADYDVNRALNFFYSA